MKRKSQKNVIARMIENAESRDILYLSWDDHVKLKHLIKCYSVILNDGVKATMYTIYPDGGIIAPVTERRWGLRTDWIVKYDREGREVLRASLKSVDLVEWELFPKSNT
jgi:hypothetical protein